MKKKSHKKTADSKIFEVPSAHNEDVSKWLAYLKTKTDDKGKEVTYAFYPFLNRERKAEGEHLEERVRMNAYNDLITTHRYPPNLIDIEYPVLIREDEAPRYADIVVCLDAELKRPFLVVETKKPNREDGEKQGQRYATILRAVYVLWTNGSSRAASVIVNRYPEDAASIEDIPSYGGAPRYNIAKLAPFKDDNHISGAFKKCHNLIRNLNHLKPDEAFGEFLKILLVKLQDEQKGKDYEFQILSKGSPPVQETEDETAQRIRQLFKIAATEDSEIADVFKQEDDIRLTNHCVSQIVALLQKNSFRQTPVDQKGRAFESFLSGDLRQEFKEFMTPRPVVESIVAMANPNRQTLILDPCCGSGAFLLFSYQHVRKEVESKDTLNTHQKIHECFNFAHDKLWGFDASKQMSSVARIAMIMNDDGRSHVFHHDSLNPRELAPEQARAKKFKLILTNPPFGKRIEASNKILEHFDLAKDENGRVRKSGSYSTEVLFLERNLTWLEPGGMMFIVLPDSVLGNKTLESARELVETKASLVGVISLSSDTFGPSGAKTKTSVLILKKDTRSSPSAGKGNVFVAHASHVGYDFTGRATGKNDLPSIVQAFLEFREGKPLTSHAHIKVVPRGELGKSWLAQPALGITDETDGGSVKLGDVCDAMTGKTPARALYTDKGIHVVKVGNLTGRGIEWNAVERQYVSADFLKKKAPKGKGVSAFDPEVLVLEPGDILITAAAHGPKWIGLKVDIFDGVPRQVENPKAIFCGEVMRLRVKKDSGIDPYVLMLWLRSSAGYKAIQKCNRGQSGHLYAHQVHDMMIPDFSAMPDDDKMKLEKAVENTKAAQKSRKEALELESVCTEAVDKMFPCDVKKPIIAL